MIVDDDKAEQFVDLQEMLAEIIADCIQEGVDPIIMGLAMAKSWTELMCLLHSACSEQDVQRMANDIVGQCIGRVYKAKSQKLN